VLNLGAIVLSADLRPSVTQLLWIGDIYGFMVAGFLVTPGYLAGAHREAGEHDVLVEREMVEQRLEIGRERVVVESRRRLARIAEPPPVIADAAVSVREQHSLLVGSALDPRLARETYLEAFAAAPRALATLRWARRRGTRTAWPTRRRWVRPPAGTEWGTSSPVTWRAPTRPSPASALARGRTGPCAAPRGRPEAG
jgi:hypothetical protein